MEESIIPKAIYLLCALTSITCAILLIRGYIRAKTRILFWASICFVTLAANNIILYVDLVVLGPETTLILWRTVPTLVGMAAFIYGLFWDTV